MSEPLTSLVGREHEIAAISGLLHEPRLRLLTLTGPGGVGKTRLAVEVAARLESAFADGVVFIEVASIHEAALLLPVVASAIGVVPAGDRPLIEQIAAQVDRDGLLLVLDNLEQIAAGPLIATLLRACPRLHVLATSRVPLRISGEHEYEVEPLPVPGRVRPSWSPRATLSLTIEEAAADRSPAMIESDAVRLFCQRARAVRPAFALTPDNVEDVAEVCRRLDGLPLAIELAAARVKVLPVETLLGRLSDHLHQLHVLAGGPVDQPPRLQTMHNAIGWSYDLLTSDERALFRRLAVCVGGFSASAAQGLVMTGDAHGRSDDPGRDLIDGLSSLVDNSLLRLEETGSGARYRMLEPIRAFALERLDAHGETAAMRHHHAITFLTLADEAGPRLLGADANQVIDRLADDLPNLRATVEWALAHDEIEIALRLAARLQPLFWSVRGNPTEGFQWLEAALARDGGSPLTRIAAGCTATGLATLCGKQARARAHGEAALALARTENSPAAIGRALRALGLAAEWQHDLAEASARYEAAVTELRTADAPYWLAIQLTNLADVTHWQGDRGRARLLIDEALDLWRETGNSWGFGLAQSAAAGIAVAAGDHARAMTLYRESLERSRRLGDRRGVAGALAGIAAIATARSEPVRAARWLGAATALADAVGVRRLPHHVEYERAVETTRRTLNASDFDRSWAEGVVLTMEDAIAEVTADEIPGPSPGLASGGPGACSLLTNREVEVLRLIVDGKTDREIGDALSISHRTAMRHVSNIYHKLSVNSRAAATAAALRRNLI